MAGERILIVDDSATQLEALRSLLEESGMHAVTARSGEEALDRLADDHFSLVLSDVVMPGMSGFGLCEQIKERFDDPPPVMLLTSLADPRDIVRGVACGADNYITKPYEARHLLDRIDHVLRNHELRDTRSADGPVRVEFLGETYEIRSDPAQILALLLSSFEELIRTNSALQESKRQLAAAHARDLQREQDARARAEADTRRTELLKQKAEDAIRARDEVLATVSHDLRNPVGTIFTSSTLLLDVELAPDAQRRQLEIIRRTAQRMDRLIQDLLDVSSMEAGRFAVDPKPEHPAALVDEAHEMLVTIAEAREITLTCDVEAGDVRVAADRERVLQIFSNLVGNAVKFTPAGGRIAMIVRQAEDGVRFTVQDSGSGIPESDLPHIFDRFWHGGTAGGSGLGLAIVQGIVEAHGGRIWAESGESGSTFHFVLPRADASQSESTPPERF